MKSPHRGREWRRSGRVHATTNVEMGTHASDALRFLALLAHGPRFGAHKERAEDNATTQLTKRQSPQLAVGHEDDITCFTIVPRILYAPLPMLFDVCFAFPLRSLSLSLSLERERESLEHGGDTTFLRRNFDFYDRAPASWLASGTS